MEVSRLANRLMASRTGANGVDIDGRHQFIDYPLWQASRFESCSDSHARARCRRRANADRRFAQDRLLYRSGRRGVKHAEVITARLVQDERGWLRITG